VSEFSEDADHPPIPEAAEGTLESDRAGQTCRVVGDEEAVSGRLRLWGLGAWLRAHFFRQGSKGRQSEVPRSFRAAVVVRHLRRRRQVHCIADGQSSTSVYALQRVTQATDRNNH